MKLVQSSEPVRPATIVITAEEPISQKTNGRLKSLRGSSPSGR